MRNGQGGYQLRTHGGRVPIQWLVGTDGWGLFIHQPLGAFDLHRRGRQVHAGRRRAAARRLRRRRRRDPKAIMREYARITGFAGAAARCWTFGYMQSHRTLAGPDEIMWVARRSARRSCRATR